MNPQYAPQQPFNMPPQGFPVNRSSPSSDSSIPTQSFQNIPLGPKPRPSPNAPSQQQPPGHPPYISTTSPMNPPPTTTPNVGSHQFPPGMGPPNLNLRPPMPPFQGQGQQESAPPLSHQFGPPPTSNPVGSTEVKPPLQNGSQQGLQNGPQSNAGPFVQNGRGFGPSPSVSNPQDSTPLSHPNVPSPHQLPNQIRPPGPGQVQNVLPRSTQPLVSGQPPLTNQNRTYPSFSNLPPVSNQSSMPGQPPISTQSTLPSQNKFGQPPISAPSTLPSQNQFGQPPISTQSTLPNQNQIGQPPPPPSQSSLPTQNQFGPPPMASQPNLLNQNQFGPPPMSTQSNLPTQNQFGQQPLSHPPLPSQMPLSGPPIQNQFGPGSLPNQGYFNQPPLPGQLGPNQLASQMQDMNLGGPRQFSGGLSKNVINGDNGPHMPPPLSQQQYLNGQQMRGPPMHRQPPMPGGPVAPGAPGAYPPMPQQLQQPKRLDPDQMPSPIQVTQDDQQNRSGIFCTNQKGLVPPLVTTNFIVQDQGNSSPRFIRSSMYNVPVSQDIMKQTSIPFSLVISPMARTVDQEYAPPIVNFGELGPVRCIRCKAYMCPYMQFIDSGRRFQCLFCKATTDVPAEYFQHLDHTGQRLDRYERPELILGTYEFVATAEYCRNNTLPKPPAIIFVIDVSYNNIKSGLVHLLCSQIKEIIQHLPVDQGQEKSNMKVGFITYNSAVHFYNIKGSLAAPQMLIVGDTQEMFMPLLDGFLCTPEESEPVIDALMQQIPAMFGDTKETETILLPAILAGLEALKASDCAGKLLVFHSTLPTAEAPGKLKNRDDRKLLGTEKERTVLTPQTQAYNQLGQDCVAAGCSVDLFIFNNAYIDIATIGQISRLTGGEVHKYTYFQADVDGDRLIKDIINNINRPIAFDAIMRVRTCTGIRPTDFYGHFFMSNTTDMELAAIDCDKAVAVEIKHDDKISEEEGVYIQAALLYTSCSGQRRLRVMNLSLKTCSQMSDLYRNCDCDTIINYIAKQATFKLYEHNPKAVKDNIVTRAAQILATYRKNCASPSSAGQLILPECMKLLPLYVNCLLKSDALSGGSDMTVDDRSYVMQQVMIMDIPTSVNYFYPRLIPLADLDPKQEIQIPCPIRCTIDKMNDQGVYILENGIHMFLWFGLNVNPDFIKQVFGVPSAMQVDIEKVTLPELDNPLSVAVRTIIDEIRVQRHRWMRLTIVRQREKLEPVFKHFLAEDRGTDGSPSYVDFLIHMHKEIRSLLS